MNLPFITEWKADVIGMATTCSLLFAWNAPSSKMLGRILDNFFSRLPIFPFTYIHHSVPIFRNSEGKELFRLLFFWQFCWGLTTFHDTKFSSHFSLPCFETLMAERFLRFGLEKSYIKDCLDCFHPFERSFGMIELWAVCISN